ncbi:energy-dependent translational throttle protein EttA [soil metagenome]
MPVLSIRGVSKAYGARPLLTDATFTLRRGEKAALLGPNGTGKSTLLRILAGLEPADVGTIDRRRDATILYLPQEPELDQEKSPRAIVSEGLAQWDIVHREHDEVSRRIGAGEATAELLAAQAALGEQIEHLGGWQRDHEVDEILSHLGIAERDRDRAVKTMSGGERRRVALARILVARPDLAILDEPTNHLDADTIAWLEEYLRDFPGAVLLVTHDRYVLDTVATRILDLENGRLTEYTKRNDKLGAYADFLEQRAERDSHEERVEKNRQNLLRREIEWLRRGPKARSTKQKARIQRADAAIAVEAPRERGAVQLVGLETGGGRLGGTILELLGVKVDIGGRTLVNELDLRLVKGDRIGVVGPNGAGKTSLLRVITKEIEPVLGKVIRGMQTKIAVLDQSRTTLEEDWTVFDNVAERKDAERVGAGTVVIGERTMDLRNYLELFLFDGNAWRRKVSALSGGERARVTLALALKSGANVLLLDEPTNDLDIATLGALEELLETWPGCVVVVSHDRWFLDRVATAILAFEGDGKVTTYAGNWSDYREKRDEEARARAASTRASSAPKAAAKPAPNVVAKPAAKPSAPPPPPLPPKKKLSYSEKIELDGLLDVIGAAEEKVAYLETRLLDPTLYAKDPDGAKSLRGEIDDAKAAVVKLTARWEALESRRG